MVSELKSMPKSNHEKRIISLPLLEKNDWCNFLSVETSKLSPGLIELHCHDWQLGCRELKQLLLILEKAGLKTSLLSSNIPQTIVSANCLGITASLNPLIKKVFSRKKLGMLESLSS